MQFRPTAITALVAATFLAAGCGSDSNAVPMSTVTVALTDSASEALDAFEVDVSDIVFTKLDGSTVPVLNRATRIDFTELRTISEMIVSVGLEAGTYTRATMTLDFSNARVWIVGNSTAATVLDKDGNPITGVVDVRIDFAVANRLRFFTGRRHLLQLDLDLDSAVSVDATGNSVTFCPVVIADLDPGAPKPVAINGLLVSADAPSRRFVVERRAVDGSTIGNITVSTGLTTVFQVDGAAAIGSPGFTALRLLGPGTRVWIQGTWVEGLHPVHAAAVEAGAGTPGNGQDWVLGHVIGRDMTAGSDATLTVLGRSLDVGTGTRRFNTSHTVAVQRGPTRVLRRGAGNSLTTDAIQVGHLVLAFGDMTGTAMAAGGANSGVVRLLRTSVFGVAAAAPIGNVLTIDVDRFDLRDVANFDFSVQGITEATPTAYTVDVTGLNTIGITTGSKVRCIGWPNAVGVVGDSDFAAVALVDHTDGLKRMLCQWVPAAPGVIASATATAVTLDVGSAALKVIADGFSPLVLTNTPAPTVRPLAGIGFYLIVQNGTLQLHLGFPAFATALNSRILAGASVFRVADAGAFDAPTQALSAFAATVILD